MEVDCINVLLFPAGSQVSQEIYDALRYEKNIKIYATGADVNNYATIYFPNYIPECPMISNADETILFLQNIIKEHNIHFIYPSFDPVFVFLAENRHRFPCKILLPETDAIETCNSKRKTYELLSSFLKTPRIYSKNDYNLPIYVKPDIGYGARNHSIITDIADIEKVDTQKYLLLEYLPGKEYTIDCFTNTKKQLVYCGSRERLRTINGLAVTSKTIDIPETKKMAEIISEKLSMKGAWFFQAKYNSENELTLLEVACRIPGSMATSRMQGINFPLATIMDSLHNNIDTILFKNLEIQSFKVYKTYYRTTPFFFDIVYCDLDDTLVIRNQINYDLMRVLYKFLNENKTLVLITRNQNPDIVQKKWRINIFDKIIVIPDRLAKKSSFIESKSCIFIDDSYAERSDVYTNIKCPVFSPSEIELFN